MTFGDGPWAYVFLFVAGFLATEPWRYLGVMLSKNIDIDSEVLVWVRAVSTALIAGLVSRLVIFPTGALVETALWMRLFGAGVGVAVFLFGGRNLGAGIFAGAGALVVVRWLIAP